MLSIASLIIILLFSLFQVDQVLAVSLFDSSGNDLDLNFDYGEVDTENQLTYKILPPIDPDIKEDARLTTVRIRICRKKSRLRKSQQFLLIFSKIYISSFLF